MRLLEKSIRDMAIEVANREPIYWSGFASLDLDERPSLMVSCFSNCLSCRAQCLSAQMVVLDGGRGVPIQAID